MPISAENRSGGRSYVFADHGTNSKDRSYGKHILKPNSKAVHRRPCWGNGFTTVRMLPGKNTSDPTSGPWEPFVYSLDRAHDYGDWIRSYPAVRSFGDPGVTFLIADPADTHAPPIEQSPAHLLFSACNRAINDGQDQQGWARLLRGGQGRSAALSKPSSVYLVQCFMMHNGTDTFKPPKGWSDDENIIMLELSPNAGGQLLEHISQLKPNPTGDDWNDLFLYGDPVALEHGQFVTFYKKADGDPRQAQQSGGNAAWEAQANNQGNKNSGENGYGCYLEGTFDNTTPELTRFAEIVERKVQNWDDILYFPTFDEQARLIADKFPPSLICYAWQDYPQWIPDNVRNQSVNKQTFGGNNFTPPPAPENADVVSPFGQASMTDHPTNSDTTESVSSNTTTSDNTMMDELNQWVAQSVPVAQPAPTEEAATTTSAGNSIPEPPAAMGKTAAALEAAKRAMGQPG